VVVLIYKIKIIETEKKPPSSTPWKRDRKEKRKEKKENGYGEFKYKTEKKPKDMRK